MKRSSKSRDSQEQPGIGALIGSLVLATIGLGLVGVAIANLVPASRARVELVRGHGRSVRGSVSYLFFGTPIFWQSLNGLARVEDQNYTRYEFGNKSHRYQGEATISRVGFVDARGRTLAWSERSSLLNQRSRITDFLQGGPSKFVFEEDMSPRGMNSQMAVVKTVTGAIALSALGLLLTYGSLNGALRTVRHLWNRRRDDSHAKRPRRKAEE